MRKSDEGKTISIWEETVAAKAVTPLESDINTDVCVIGGGIAGLTTAYLLAKAGHKVAVVDDGQIGGGETSRTTAHLSNAIDDRIYRIEKWHGAEKAKLAVESHTSAIDEIERIVNTENIDCGFMRLDGYLFEAEESEDDLGEELSAAHRCGLSNVRWVDRAPMVNIGRCLHFPRQGQFHVLEYLDGLVDAVERMGGRLFSGSRVTAWTGGNTPAATTAGGHTVTAENLVLATNYPLMSNMFAELPAYRTYAVGVEMPADSLEPALYWDTGDPYIYVRTQDEGDHQILIVGGEDHRTGQANDGPERFQRLFSWAKKRFPSAGVMRYKWSGQFLETHDGLAFLGRYSSNEPNVYLITGDSGMGMTHGTIGSILIRDLIEGVNNPWADVYDPSRIATQSLSQAVPEIVSSTLPYKDWLTGGDISSVDELGIEEGGVIRDGLQKLAVYRSSSGELVTRSAVCTHLGCIVRFNSLEKTWDCPCHGSRFSTDGEPINAPAITPLEKV